MTGATASLRGSAKFGTFAAGKFAQRALTQSLAREFGPQGVHVALAIIDGSIDTPWGKERVANGGVEDGKISPDSVRLSLIRIPQSQPLSPAVLLTASYRLPRVTGTCTPSTDQLLLWSWISDPLLRSSK